MKELSKEIDFAYALALEIRNQYISKINENTDNGVMSGRLHIHKLHADKIIDSLLDAAWHIDKILQDEQD